MAYTALIVAKVPSIDLNLDGFSNHFVFHSDEATDASGISPVLTHVEAFYNHVHTGDAVALCGFLSKSLDRGSGHATITAYNITGHLDGSPHGGPVAAGTWTLGANSGDTVGMPEGVCCCLNGQSAYGTDVEFGVGTRPRARDRNRWYIGPLISSSQQLDSVTFRSEFTPAFMATLLDAVTDLSTSVVSGSEHWVLHQWSKKKAATAIFTEFWCDNRPDYQRRRSDPTPTTRTYQAASSA